METNKKFKCKDEVIYRFTYSIGTSPWTFGIFSHCENDFAVINGNKYSNLFLKILPYEGNEHLVGTTDEPDEEVRLEKGEWIMVASGVYDHASEWFLRQFDRTREKFFLVVNGGYFGFAIRFSDFNPNDIEETKKHILCVKNGKVVKYRE